MNNFILYYYCYDDDHHSPDSQAEWIDIRAIRAIVRVGHQLQGRLKPLLIFIFLHLRKLVMWQS